MSGIDQVKSRVEQVIQIFGNEIVIEDDDGSKQTLPSLNFDKYDTNILKMCIAIMVLDYDITINQETKDININNNKLSIGSSSVMQIMSSQSGGAGELVPLTQRNPVIISKRSFTTLLWIITIPVCIYFITTTLSYLFKDDINTSKRLAKLDFYQIMNGMSKPITDENIIKLDELAYRYSELLEKEREAGINDYTEEKTVLALFIANTTPLNNVLAIEPPEGIFSSDSKDIQSLWTLPTYFTESVQGLVDIYNTPLQRIHDIRQNQVEQLQSQGNQILLDIKKMWSDTKHASANPGKTFMDILGNYAQYMINPSEDVISWPGHFQEKLRLQLEIASLMPEVMHGLMGKIPNVPGSIKSLYSRANSIINTMWIMHSISAFLSSILIYICGFVINCIAKSIYGEKDRQQLLDEFKINMIKFYTESFGDILTRNLRSSKLTSHQMTEIVNQITNKLLPPDINDSLYTIGVGAQNLRTDIRSLINNKILEILKNDSVRNSLNEIKNYDNGPRNSNESELLKTFIKDVQSKLPSGDSTALVPYTRRGGKRSRRMKLKSKKYTRNSKQTRKQRRRKTKSKK